MTSTDDKKTNESSDLTGVDIDAMEDSADKAKKSKRGVRKPKSMVTAEIKPDPFMASLAKQQIEVPIWTQEEMDKVQVDPLALHPELLDLEAQKKFKFCWIPKPLTQKDRELLSLYHPDFGATGKYVYATRVNFEHELSETAAEELFSVSGAIEKGDLALGVMRYDMYEKKREAERKASISQAEAARRGRDAFGQIPNVQPDDGGGNFDFTIPNQPLMDGDDDVAPELYSD
jgi:hypothetical protein